MEVGKTEAGLFLQAAFIKKKNEKYYVGHSVYDNIKRAKVNSAIILKT